MGKKRTLPNNRQPQSSGVATRRPPYAFAAQLLLGCIALGGLGLGIYLGVTGDSLAEVRVLDELDHQRVEQLRQTMAVTNQDLAAMGLPPEQAETVIQAVLTWSDQNSERLAGADRAVRDAETELRLARRALQSGEPREGASSASYADLSAAVERARAAHRSILTEFESGLATQLSAASEDWAAAKLNAGWVTDSLSARPDENTLRKSIALRLAAQGEAENVSPAADVQAYRDRLANTGMIAAVSRQVYQTPVVVKPLEPSGFERP